MSRTKTVFSIIAGSIVFLLFIYVGFLWPWCVTWGTVKDEADENYPGDKIIQAPLSVSTRAITINSPAIYIWPWIVQMGQGRGGFYSYGFLQNDMKNADTILTNFQTLEVGDRIVLDKRSKFDIVASVDPYNYLILHTANFKTGGPTTLKKDGFVGTWTFILRPLALDQTRFIIRTRNVYENNFNNFITWRLLTEPASFFMEQKMMRTIKANAEKIYTGK